MASLRCLLLWCRVPRGFLKIPDTFCVPLNPLPCEMQAYQGGFPAGSLGFPTIFAWSFEGILAMGTHVKLGSPWVPLLSQHFLHPFFNASLQLGDV